MANIKSAKKRIRVIDKKTARNKRVKNHLKESLKAFEIALEEGNFDEASEKLKLAEKKLMHLKECSFQKSFKTDQKIQRRESSKISLTRPHRRIS